MKQTKHKQTKPNKKSKQGKKKHVKVVQNPGLVNYLWSIRILFFFFGLVLKPIWGLLCTWASVCENVSEIWKELRNKLFEAITTELSCVCFGCWSCGRCFPCLAFTPVLCLGYTFHSCGWRLPLGPRKKRFQSCMDFPSTDWETSPTITRTELCGAAVHASPGCRSLEPVTHEPRSFEPSWRIKTTKKNW